MDNIELNPQDVIDVLTLQRNAALDEIVRQAAIIKALERKLTAPAPPQKEDEHGPG
jgi:hypothetical protein